jgi:hypothetical protein
MKAKDEFLRSHEGEKKGLKKKVEKLKADIAGFSGHIPGQGFDWAVEFAEVFLTGGFDISIANPPFVRMELFKSIKPTLRANFPAIHAERADLYCYFYARGVELLRQDGMFVFISPNKWLRAGYGSRLRVFMESHCRINSITDFGDLPVFQAATAYPMIFCAQRVEVKQDYSPVHTRVPSLDSPYPEVSQIVKQFGSPLQSSDLAGAEWNLGGTSYSASGNGTNGSFKPLLEYAGGQVLYGVKTGMNEAFVIDAETKRSLCR